MRFGIPSLLILLVLSALVVMLSIQDFRSSWRNPNGSYTFGMRRPKTHRFDINRGLKYVQVPKFYFLVGPIVVYSTILTILAIAIRRRFERHPWRDEWRVLGYAIFPIGAAVWAMPLVLYILSP